MSIRIPFAPTPRIARAVVCLMAALLLAAIPSSGLAQTTTTGDVLPGAFPFADENIGVTNQTVNIFVLDPESPQPEYERGDNIEIGRTSFGSVRVSGGDNLRWEHLILGGTEDDFNANDLQVATLVGSANGHGVMRLEQLGSSFNNHPLIIPTIYQDIYPFAGTGSNPEATYFDIPTTRGVDVNFDGDTDDTGETLDSFRTRDAGFDAVIGLTGTGELFLNTGARMEIEDAFVVAYGSTSSGYVEVDGVGTYLGVYGGLNPNALTLNRGSFAAGPGIHQMVIGAYGDAEMRITGGAHVDAFYGAAIGTTRSDGEDEITDPAFDSTGDPQGSGRVVVDGQGSSWNVTLTAFADDDLPASMTNRGGALAIGEFNEALVPAYANEELGQGHLSIRNGGHVNVSRFVEQNNPFGAGDDIGDALIGRAGTLDLRGGRLTVRDQLISDGLIQAIYDGEGTLGGAGPGGGEINVSTFENRTLGEVRIGPGQNLKVVSRAPLAYVAPNASESFTGRNAGLIEVRGDVASGRAEFEYDREFTASPIGEAFLSGGVRSTEVFYNAGEIATERGQIVAQEATLRFRRGVWNAGDVNFVGGENLVSGTVMNAPSLMPADPTLLPGRISLSNASHVTFDSSVTNDGTITLSDDSSATFLGQETPTGGTMPLAYHGTGALNIVSTGDVHVAGNFALGDPATDVGGTLRLWVEDFTRDAFSHVVIDGEGDFTFGTPATIEILELAPPSGIGPTLSPGDEFEFITVLGGPSVGPGPGGVIVNSLPATGSEALAFMPVFDDNSFSLLVVEDTSIGADFNGDGMVDAADMATWRHFHGLQLGASGAHGDVDLDGDVDGEDFVYLMDQFGGAGVPVIAVVPEPAGLAMLAMVGLVWRRRG